MTSGAPAPLLRFSARVPTRRLVPLILRVVFPDAGTCLDPTYGRGNFWDGTEHVRVSHHRDDVDMRDLPYADASFDVVVLDPPHIAEAGTRSIMGQRFGTNEPASLFSVIRDGTREAWRVGRLGVLVKVTDHIHRRQFWSETDCVRAALGWRVPYDVVHQVRERSMRDPKWGEQLSAYNNGSTYLVFRKGGQRHERRG